MKDSPILKFLGAILVLCVCMVCGSTSAPAATNDPATPYTITGTVKTTTGTPLVDVVVFASTYVDGTNYQAVNGVTDSNGRYTINVFGNAEWYLTPDCYQGSNNIDHQGYLCLDSQYVKIGSANGSANFATIPYSDSIDELDGSVYDTDKNPVAGVTVYATNSANGQTVQTTTDVNGFYYFFVADETSWNLGVDCNQLASKGYSCPGIITNAIIRDRSTCCQNFTVTPTTSTSTPPFFTGEVALGTPGWYWLGPQGSNTYGFGYFSTKYAPYIFHQDLGWEYFLDAGNARHGAYFYDFSNGVWWYSDPGLFPYMYDFNLNTWMFYAPQQGKTDSYQSSPRLFLNTATKQWVNDL